MKRELNEIGIRSIDLISEKGASRRLNAMPLLRYHFDLTKIEFRDGIALRYGGNPIKMASPCACKEKLTAANAHHCQKKGYIQMRHIEHRDSF